jgi:2'-5' RNA ligase
MLRLFIGVDVPRLAPLCRLIDRLGRMGPSVRPVRPDAMHITLRFLGDTDPRHVNALCHAMDVAVREAVDVGWLSPFDLLLTSVGTFPGKPGSPPRVVFAAPDDAGPLHGLSDAIDTRIDTLGLPIPGRDQPFHPHVTLARIKRRRSPDRRATAGINQLITDTDDAGLGSMRIKQVKLIESRPGPQGQEYFARHTSPFK